MTGAVMEVVFGIGLLLGVWLLFSNHLFVEQLAQAPSRLARWKGLVMRRPSDNALVAADQFTYQETTRQETEAKKQERAWYNTRRKMVIGDPARVHVTPDVIARLDFADGFFRQSSLPDGIRLLDSSRFCLSTEPDKGFIVRFLPRGRRWCLEYGEQDGLKTREGDVLTCQVAVHAYIDLPLGKGVPLDWLFNNLSEQAKVLRNSVRGVLGDQLQGRGYREAMYYVPEIVDALNDHWAQDAVYSEFRKAIGLHFTGVIIAPIRHREREALEGTHYSRLHAVNVEIARLEDREHMFNTRLKNQWNNQLNNLEIIGAFEGLPATLQAAADSAQKNIVEGQIPEELEQLWQGIYTPDHDLQGLCSGFESACKSLRTFLGSLRGPPNNI